jgi:hypothetical protein
LLARPVLLGLPHGAPERGAPRLLQRGDHVLHERQVGEHARLLERARQPSSRE